MEARANLFGRHIANRIRKDQKRQLQDKIDQFYTAMQKDPETQNAAEAASWRRAVTKAAFLDPSHGVGGDTWGDIIDFNLQTNVQGTSAGRRP